MSLTIAIGMARTWVAVYTVGLPKLIRAMRRMEIDSDLWEQRQLAGLTGESAFGTASEVVARILLGAISDITWRVQTGLSAPSDRSINVNDSIIMRGLFLLAVGLAITPVCFGLYMTGGGGEWSSSAERIVFGLLSASTGIAMVSGLVLSTKRPELGIGLVAVGAVGISVMWYWAAFITAPIGAALVFLAYFRARGTGWPRGAGTA